MPGSKSRAMLAERYTWALLLAASSPLATTAADAPPAPPALAAADAELLEFLGEFHDAKGEFVDPFVIDAVGTELAAVAREEAEQKRLRAQQEQRVAAPATQAAPPAPPERQP